MALSPTFSSDVEEYTAETSDSTAKVTASADSSLTVALTFNDVAIENEDTVTFEDGENVLEVTVTNSASEEKVYTVTITKDDPAKLTGLTIGALTLTPTFDADVEEYAVTTSNASNKVTATAAEGLTVTLDLDGTAIENESSPSWEVGPNILTVTVENGIGESTAYVVTVTKTE